MDNLKTKYMNIRMAEKSFFTEINEFDLRVRREKYVVTFDISVNNQVCV